MRASTFFISAAAVAVASAQSTTVDAFPQTTFLRQTNSLGVVTGQPAVATSQPAVATNQNSQPAVVTAQPPVNSIPAVGTGIHTLLLPGPSTNVNATQTVVVSANNSTTIILGAPTSSGATPTGSGAMASGASGSRASGSPTGSGSASQSSGAAVANGVAGSFIGLGAVLAAFL